MASTAAPSALASGTHTETNRVKLHLPKRGHRLVSRDQTRIPRRLRRLIAFVQILDPNGRYSPKAAAGQPLIFARPDGTKLFSVTLKVRYVPKTGRLRLALTVRNIGVRRYKAKDAVVRARVTIAWQR